jgi:hypothetical protein
VGGHNLWMVEVSPAVPPPRIVTSHMGRNIPRSWNTFSFVERRIVTAASGVMTLRDTATGAPINTVPLPAGRFGTQPDWAPDSTLMAFVDSPTNRDRGIDGAQIAVIEKDNLPSWAPSGAPNDYAWIAFSSTRDYGAVLSRASRLGQHEQLWVTAIDLERARMGTMDPSAPPFRLPSQDLDEDTHRPFWAEDRVRLDPDGGVRDAGGDASGDASRDASPEARTDTGTDAGADARADVACVPMNGVCAAGGCCPGLVCWDFGGGDFRCTNAPR